MDVRLELKRWKADFALVNTKEQKAEYDKRFKAFLASLSSAERKEFAQAYREGAKEAIDKLKESQRLLTANKNLTIYWDLLLCHILQSIISENPGNGYING